MVNRRTEEVAQYAQGEACPTRKEQRSREIAQRETHKDKGEKACSSEARDSKEVPWACWETEERTVILVRALN